MENLPQEIIIDVLSRLPVKSVVRFRCVCKSWLSLISESKFVKKHLDRAITDDVSVSIGCQRIILCSSPLKSIDYEEEVQNNGDCACTVLDFPTSGPDHHDILFGSCNGMVGIIVDNNKIILCNPCTRDFRVLPELSEITLNYDILLYGLGYDSCADDYKVVIAVPAVFDYGDAGEVEVEVFSLRSNSWRRLPDIHGNSFCFATSCGAFLNGALHWLVVRETLDRVILTFDLATEKFQELLPLPPNQGDNYLVCSLNILAAYLSLHCCERNGKHDIWVMKEHGLVASWTKLFTIREDSFEFGSAHYLRPVCFSKNGELLVDVGGVQLIIYNPKEETSRELYIINNGNRDWDETIVYIESLVSPNIAQEKSSVLGVSAAAPMPNLSQDIIIDVLSRLPVKSIVRFRCVCKPWRSLLSEPRFVKKHLDRAISDVSVRCQRVLLCSSPLKSMDYEEVVQNNGDCACTVLDFPTSGPDHHDILFGSCNGMVGIIVDNNKIILCNPCTRDFRVLPELSEITLNYDILLYGLGYDSCADDYKVVIAVPAVFDYGDASDIRHAGEVEVEVFSLRSNSWRRLADIHGNIFCFATSCGAFLNGALHWLVVRETLDRVILTFDLATEKFQELLPLPPNQGDNYLVCSLNILAAYLSLHCCERNGKHDIWVMKEHGLVASWTKLFTIREDSVEFGSAHYLRPVCFSKNGELLVDVGGVQLIIYNPKEETSRELYIINNGNRDWDETIVYIESLVSPNIAQEKSSVLGVSAAAPIPNLSQDIIIDVLSRLPVKSIVRFRCVCKPWRSLLYKPRFVKKHLDRAISDVSVGCQKVLLCSSPLKSMDYEEVVQNNGDCACTVLDFPTSGPDHHDILFGSCNGMVGIIDDNNMIILCNPCTRDFRVLPELSEITLFYGIHSYGLGYDSCADDYKVVIAVPAVFDYGDASDVRHTGEVEVEVFSLRSHSWRRLPDIHGIIFCFGTRCGAFLNGALHWLVVRETLDRVILTFDLATEKFQELLPLPPNQGDNYFVCSLNILAAYLSLHCYERNGKHDIWVMKGYGLVASWTKLFTIREDCVEFGIALRPVCFTKNGELLVDVDGVQLIIYNPKEETSRELYITYTDNENQDWNETIVYTESLVSPNIAQEKSSGK